jgi:hypothetical protein
MAEEKRFGLRAARQGRQTKDGSRHQAFETSHVCIAPKLR